MTDTSIQHRVAVDNPRPVGYFAPSLGGDLPPRVYLASRYSRRDELLGYAQELRRYGYLVTSRWLLGTHEITDEGRSAEADFADRQRFALEDWDDLCDSNMLIAFTEPQNSSASRGGRHVEVGIALALGLRILVVGHRENVFHCLPQVRFFAEWEDCLEALKTSLN